MGIEKKLESSDFNYFNSRSYQMANAVFSGLFFGLFLAIFLPFGISNYNPNHQYTLEFVGLIGLISFLTTILALINEFFLKPRLIKSPQIIHIVLWSLWLIFILGLSNYLLYNFLGNWHDFNWTSGIDFVLNCSAVLIIPLFLVFFYFRYQNLKVQFEEIIAHRPSKDEEKIVTFEGQGLNEKINIKLKDFLFAKAQDNYIEIAYIDHQQIHKILLRSTLSQFLKTSDERIIRCHRSYAINLINARSFTEGSNMMINLNHTTTSIPVSKSFKAPVLEELKKL